MTTSNSCYTTILGELGNKVGGGHDVHGRSKVCEVNIGFSPVNGQVRLLVGLLCQPIHQAACRLLNWLDCGCDSGDDGCGCGGDVGGGEGGVLSVGLKGVLPKSGISLQLVERCLDNWR